MKSTLIVTALAAALGACSTLPSGSSLPLGAAPAPVTFDGNVAGRATEYVFVLVPDSNPSTPGVSLKAGETIRIRLPAAFKRNDQVAINPDADTNMVFTKGWPQAGIKLQGQYRIGYDARSNSISAIALADIGTVGANAPGIKIIHLRGRTFINPLPADYAVTVEHIGSDGKTLDVWSGSLKVKKETPKARLAASNFHLPPGSNGDFQKVAVGQVLPNRLGLLLWGEAGAPLNGVGIAPRDLTHFPRYTGGLLVQDANGDHVLDPAVDKVVGGIIGAAPDGATGQSATSPHISRGQR
jgi:hypothetical protein